MVVPRRCLERAYPDSVDTISLRDDRLLAKQAASERATHSAVASERLAWRARPVTPSTVAKAEGSIWLSYIAMFRACEAGQGSATTPAVPVRIGAIQISERYLPRAMTR